MATLCAPGPDLICFGCCPPIRPAGYDPLDHVGSLRREFAENRRRFLAEGPQYHPIVGYSCWALGFLDSRGRLAGCLLHPLQNDGRDLRYLIDYEDKCERESCLAARMFARLPEPGQRFWLSLVQGLSSFYYSSTRANPLFHILLWGPEVLEPLRIESEQHGWEASELIGRRPFLADPGWEPRTHRYLFRVVRETLESRETSETLEALETPEPQELLKNQDSRETLKTWPQAVDKGQAASALLERYCTALRPRVRAVAKAVIAGGGSGPRKYLHQLPVPGDFADYVRGELEVRRLEPQTALDLEPVVRRLVQEVLAGGGSVPREVSEPASRAEPLESAVKVQAPKPDVKQQQTWEQDGECRVDLRRGG